MKGLINVSYKKIHRSQMKRPICGGIHAIKGAQHNLEIGRLARFAVVEHNNKENALLEFGKVVSAKQQVVAGILYYITMEVTDGGHKKEYEAEVWVRPWMKFKELLEFKPVKATLRFFHDHT